MGSGGGGNTTTTTQPTPEVSQLQASAIPQITSMVQQNPLASYANWMPRTMAGTNPFFEAMLGLTPSLAQPLQAMNTLYGPQPSVFPGMPVPNVGPGPYGPPTTTPGPPPPLANVGKAPSGSS
jgi:hypothetical protein